MTINITKVRNISISLRGNFIQLKLILQVKGLEKLISQKDVV